MVISLDQAIQLVVQHTHPLSEVLCPVQDCWGRVLTEDVRSPIFQPPFDRSPLDGYALIAADLQTASREHPITLQVVDCLYAGQESTIPVYSGTAVRLMTGAMIPSGANCVIRQEDTDYGKDRVQIFRPLKAGENVCRKGEEYRHRQKESH